MPRTFGNGINDANTKRKNLRPQLESGSHLEASHPGASHPGASHAGASHPWANLPWEFPSSGSSPPLGVPRKLETFTQRKKLPTWF